MEIKNKTAIVTGGSSGLGKATAELLNQQGAQVVVFDIQENTHSIDEIGFIATDVSDDASVKRNVYSVYEKHGSIDLLVNCAGVVSPGKVLSKKGNMTYEHFSRVIQINLLGTMNLIRHCSAKMAENENEKSEDRGVIINTSSIATFEGQIGQTAYAASKGAISSMTLPLSRELASQNIRVMCIAPGIFSTPMIQSLPDEVQQSLANMIPFPSRLGNPKEYANLVQHIIENQMLNGTTIRLDGAVRMQAK